MRKKILIPMAVVAVVCAAVIGLLGVYVVRQFVGDFNDEQLSRAHIIAETMIESYIGNARRAAATVAENSQLAAAVQECLKNQNNTELTGLTVSLMASAGMDFLTVTDADGVVLARAHQPDNVGDSMAYLSNIEYALLGERYATVEQGSSVKLSARCGSPIYSEDGQLLGALSLGIRLDDSTFVREVKQLTNTEVSIFLGGTLVSTTILPEGGGRTSEASVPSDVLHQVMEGKEYTGNTALLGKSLFASFSPLRSADGTILGMLFVGLDTSEIDARMVRDTWIMCGVVCTLGLLSLFVSWDISSRLSRPVKAISDTAKQLAKGDVNIDLGVAFGKRTADEVNVLAREFQKMIATIRQQAKTLATVADGDYSVAIPVRSEHDIINRAINTLIDRSNEMLVEINSSAAQVSSGSKRIADVANSLALGSAEQSRAIEKLATSMHEIADKTNGNAGIAREAAALTGIIRVNAEKGTERMTQLMQAAKESSEASSQIGEVIKVIDDIAFQTNILALNASIEAARAGSHGAGFAVVAEEVRILAAKSAESARHTGGLIENSMEKAQIGMKVATETSASLQEIVEGINRSAEIVTQIVKSSAEQAETIALMNNGINQVAQVVQRNSATAQESAAASQEMNGQSNLLANLILQFKLKNSLDEDIPGLPPARPMQAV